MTPRQLDQRREVDRQVEALFARSAAFQALPVDERVRIRKNTADIVATLAHNRSAHNGVRPGAGPLGTRPIGQRRTVDPYAVPLAGEGPPLPGIPGAQLPGTAGAGQQGQRPTFTGGAQPGASTTLGPEKLGDFGTGIAVGVQQAGELLRQVNFPAFVAELIQGVFQAVVDASIQQMRAYGEMVQSVAMSLNDFRDANVSENQARDHLVGKFPNLMQINITDQGPRAGLRPGADIDNLPNISASLGLDEPITDLDDETVEEVLVPAARNDLARSRQTLLATMLLMGINRIIVTDGKINAKLKFNFSAGDTMTRHAQDFDYQNFGTTVVEQRTHEESEQTGENYSKTGGGWFSRPSRSGESSRWSKGTDQRTEMPTIYLTNITDTQTDAQLQASAALSGEVSLNFRSDVVDLNQLASAADIFRLERVRSAGRAAPGTAASGAPAGSQSPAGAPPPGGVQQQQPAMSG